jgi:hypothetical protein
MRTGPQSRTTKPGALRLIDRHSVSLIRQLPSDAGRPILRDPGFCKGIDASWVSLLVPFIATMNVRKKAL